MPKRLLVANDLPGIGKVALAASLPLLAACQVEVAILPTILLSSHTGGFSQIKVADTSELLPDYLAQWQSLQLKADGLLIGYSRSSELLKQLAHYAKQSKIPILLDPILGDAGKLYSGFDTEYVTAMRELAGKSTVLIPNLTEASLLTGKDYLGEAYSQADVENILYDLATLGAQHIFLTGISFEEDKIGVVYYHVATGEISYYMTRKFSGHFFGTGDILASLIAAAFVEKIDFNLALPLIMDFLEKSLATTLSLSRDLKYGVYFEPYLAQLSKEFQTLRSLG